jgi:hypothetical protein
VGQEAIASRILGAIERMFQGRQVIHDAATISEGTKEVLDCRLRLRGECR